MSEKQKTVAREAFSTWLARPDQLGKEPNKLECVESFELYGLRYYIFRYRKYIVGKWLVGVCGGYEKDATTHCGHIMSEYHRYDVATAKKHCIDMVEKLIATSKNGRKVSSSHQNQKNAKNSELSGVYGADGVVDKPNGLKDSGKEYEVVEKLGVRNYKMKHPGECKTIWQTMVPNNGPSEYVQGELLRQIEKLRNEAVDNGNINWDDDFIYFCDYVSATLTGSMLFDKQKCIIIRGCMTYIKENGIYAGKVRDGEIPEENVDVWKLAYVHDDLYDYIADVIAEFYTKNEELIPYKKPDNVLR